MASYRTAVCKSGYHILELGEDASHAAQQTCRHLERPVGGDCTCLNTVMPAFLGDAAADCASPSGCGLDFILDHPCTETVPQKYEQPIKTKFIINYCTNITCRFFFKYASSI